MTSFKYVAEEPNCVQNLYALVTQYDPKNLSTYDAHIYCLT
jgi:hypothetical protein